MILPLSFTEWATNKGYSQTTIKHWLTRLQRIEREIGDPANITPEQIRNYFWEKSKATRKHTVIAIKRYHEYLADCNEISEDISAFFEVR